MIVYSEGDILRPSTIGRGHRSYLVIGTEGGMMRLVRINVKTGKQYGTPILLSVKDIVDGWEAASHHAYHAESAPGWEGPMEARKQWSHDDWMNGKHYAIPVGTNL